MERDKAIANLDKIIEFSLYGLVFTLPFSKSMVEVFFSLAFILWVVKRALIKTFKPAKTRLNLPIGVFVLMGFLSMLTSVSLPLSLEGFFFKLFEWVMIFFIAVETFNGRKKLDRILVVLLVSMAVIGLNGIFQHIAGVDFIRGYCSQGTSVSSSFFNPNSFGGWLTIMIPLALSLACFDTNNRFTKNAKLLLWILTAVLIFCLALTHTRGAWIGVLLSLVFIGVFKDKKLLIIVIAALLFLPFIVPDSLKDSVTSLFSSSDRNVSVRTELWREALNIVRDFPLLGSGLNTYAIVAPGYKVTESTGFYPHNSYLQMAADSGLLGLGAFIWIAITLFITSLANLKRIGNGFFGALLIGLLAGLFGFWFTALWM